MTFLIADNSQTVLEVLDFTLEQYGFKVFKAHDSKSLIDIYSQNKVDFVLLNTSLGQEQGTDLAEKLLSLRPSKILMMSSTQNLQLKRKAKEIGVVGWILKPFIPNHLVKTIIKTFLEK